MWQPVWEAIIEERRFYEGQHFEEPRNPHQRDRRDLYVTTQDTFDVVRHKVAKLTDAPFIIEPRPVDQESDPDDAERAGSILQWETTNPQKMFDDYCELMCVSALAARIGAIWIDWEPELGPWGELLFRPGDCARTMWEPGYHDPHDLSCGWVVEERYIPRSWLRANPKLNQAVVEELKDEQRPADDGRESLETGQDEGDDGVLLRFWWWKNDRTMREKPVKDKAFTPFADEGDRCMVCASPDEQGCGWRSQPQAMPQTELEHEAGEPYDEWMPGACPMCRGDLWRVDGRPQVQDVLVHPQGRRLTIEAPNQRGVRKPLYDGAWPVKGLRSVPLYVLTDYLPADPRKPCGPSDTALNWTTQIALDLLLTKGFLALDAHQRYFSLPEAGVNDWQGKRFQFRDDQFNVMYYDESKFGGPPKIDAFEGSSLDAAVPAFFGMLRGVLTSRQGIADFGLTEANSKNIPATTVMQLGQMGELPVEHLRRRYHRALARGHGVLWDCIRATYPAARLARLRLPDGTDALEWLRGDEQPNYDFVISDAPQFEGLEKSKTEALDAMIGRAPGAPIPPEYLELYASVNNISPSLLRKVQKKRAELEQKARAASGALPGEPDQAGERGLALPGEGAPNNGGGAMSPLARMALSGMRGGGMVPSG